MQNSWKNVNMLDEQGGFWVVGVRAGKICQVVASPYWQTSTLNLSASRRFRLSEKALAQQHKDDRYDRRFMDGPTMR